jgi:hypothetical protein
MSEQTPDVLREAGIEYRLADQWGDFVHVRRADVEALVQDREDAERDADALQGEVDELKEWQRRVCALLAPDGDRGELLPELAEEAIRQLRSDAARSPRPTGGTSHE